MGVGRRQVAFLAASRQLGVTFERTLMLGRQRLFIDEAVLTSALIEAGHKIGAKDAQRVTHRQAYADELFRYLGAQRVDAIDASDYEGSTIVHDMNVPLPEHLREKYSVVLDSGTLEHIFNFPVALRNCLSATRVGGHFIAITPANNWFGHGFYQFSPELFYRALSEQNGYRVRCMLVRADRRGARWYAVSDPADIGRRITLSGAWPSLLYIVAERLHGRESPLRLQQSDYEVTWKSAGPLESAKSQEGHAPSQSSRAQVLWELFPLQQVRDWFRVLLNRDASLRPVRLDRLGDVPDHASSRS